MQEGEEEHNLVCAAAAFNYVVCRVEEVVCSAVTLADFLMPPSPCLHAQEGRYVLLPAV